MLRPLLVVVLLSLPALGTPRLLDAPLAAEPSAGITLTQREIPSWWSQAGVGAGAALVSATVAPYLGMVIGQLSNQILWAVLPGLLVTALIPPLAVALAEIRFGNMNAPGTFPFWRVFGLTAVAHVGMMILGGFMGVSVGVFTRVLALALGEAVVLPLVCTGSARWLMKDPAEPVSALPRAWKAGETAEVFAPVAAVRF